MNKAQTQHPKSRLLPFPVIVAASGGDIGALNTVVKHYEGYIGSSAEQKKSVKPKGKWASAVEQVQGKE